MYWSFPPGDGSESATNSEGWWEVDSPLVFDNVANRGRILAFGSFIVATADMQTLVDISDASNKPEGTRFYGGQWCAGDVSLTSIFRSTGVSDAVFADLNVNLFGTGSVDYGFDFESSDGALSNNDWRNVEANSISETSIRIRNGGSGITINTIESLSSGSSAQPNQHVEIVGDVDRTTVEGVFSTSTSSAVLLASDSTGYPTKIDISEVHADGGVALTTEDRSGGSSATIRGITAEKLHGPANGTAVNLDYIENADVHVATQYQPEIIVGADAQNIDIDLVEAAVNPTWSIDASASRITRNGVGENEGDPNSTGQWNGNGYEGAVVVDTTNGVAYHYLGGSWV